MNVNNEPEIKWGKIYLFVLGFNVLLVILFYLIRVYFNTN